MHTCDEQKNKSIYRINFKKYSGRQALSMSLQNGYRTRQAYVVSVFRQHIVGRVANIIPFLGGNKPAVSARLRAPGNLIKLQISRKQRCVMSILFSVFSLANLLLSSPHAPPL